MTANQEYVQATTILFWQAQMTYQQKRRIASILCKHRKLQVQDIQDGEARSPFQTRTRDHMGNSILHQNCQEGALRWRVCPEEIS